MGHKLGGKVCKLGGKVRKLGGLSARRFGWAGLYNCILGVDEKLIRDYWLDAGHDYEAWR